MKHHESKLDFQLKEIGRSIKACILMVQENVPPDIVESLCKHIFNAIGSLMFAVPRVTTYCF